MVIIVSVAAAPAAGTPAVPLRATPDQAGNAVFGHTLLQEIGSPPVATPVSPAQPLAIGAGSGPLLDASPPSVGTSSTLVLEAPQAGVVRRHIEAQNVGLTTIAVNFGAPATLGAGSNIIGPLGSIRFGAPAYIPSDAMFAISSAAGGALTLKWA